MDYKELQQSLGLDNKDIIATLIKPIRKGDVYKSGRVVGFKPGIFGGGWSDYHKDHEKPTQARSFNSFDMKWIKKPKIMISYNAFTFGKIEHFDWVDIDNCTFEFKDIV